MKRLRIVSVVVLAAPLSCALIAGLEDGRLRGEPPLEDGSGGSEAGDATTTTDGGRFCADRPDAALCADFDRGVLADGWDSYQTANGGTMTLDETTSRSPPRGALASLPSGDTGPWLERRLAIGAAPRKLVCEVDVLHRAIGNGGHFRLIEIQVDTQNGGFFDFAFLSEWNATSFAYLDDNPDAGGAAFGYIEITPNASAPIERWQRYRLEIDLETGRVRGAVDGTEIGVQSPRMPPASTVIDATFVLGLAWEEYSPATQPWVVAFDSLVCSIE